ncbi:YndJ family protein [Jannaschia sp. R86511]|uniref:YndJ family protein n=1 Tax=Jannaschia sp. R86511 TaxID=3093853 RepID=UPI0036D283F3
MTAAEAVVALVVGVGAVLLLPLGLRLVDAPGLRPLARAWPVLGLACAVPLWLPRGPLAAGLATVYLLATLVLVGCAVARVLAVVSRVRAGGGLGADRLAGEVAVGAALVSPAVAAVALVAERAGVELFGFDLEILALTSPHLHYAGFVAALVAALVHRHVAGSGWARLGAWTVPAGTALVAVGHFLGAWVELLGTVVLSAGMWAVAALVLTRVGPQVNGLWPRRGLVGSVVLLPVTMLLALSWAVGRATGLPHLPIDWMVLTHGVGNAVGFGLCGVLAWTAVRRGEARL